MPSLTNILALACLAIITLSYQAHALVADRAQVARFVHGHDAVAKRKRTASTGRCNPSPTSSLPASTPPPLAYTSPSSTYTPPSPTSTTPASPAPSPTSGTTSKKWGLAFNADSSVLANFHLSKVGYIYDWAPTLPSSIPSGIVPIPQLWGYNQVTQFTTTVVPGYANIVFGMNEPNEVTQANMSPAAAIQLWMTNIIPLGSQGYYLVSPACTDDAAGLTWYQQFFALCWQTSGCYVNGIAFHAYNTDPQAVIDYANTLHNTYNMDIWMTEFADQNYSGVGSQATMDEVWNFAGQIVNFVDNTDWMKGAFPFGIVNDLQGVNTDNALLGSDGYPTALAYYYFGTPV